MLRYQAPTVGYRDVWVEHQHGRIFARIWEPSEDMSQPVPESPIVLFHDSLGCVDLWRGFPAELSAASGRRVIAYDRLGFGRSDRRRDQLTLDFIADEAKTYFPTIGKRIGFQRFIAFGHSVGGGMAVNCAAEFADSCEALITESAQVFPEDLTLKNIAAAKEQFKDPEQIERLKKYHGEKAKWVLDAWTDTWLHPGFANWTLEPVLPRATCPVLAIHGAHDEYGTTRHPEMITQLTSGESRCEIMANTYHVPHREHEESVVKIVSEFLASLQPIGVNQEHC